MPHTMIQDGKSNTSPVAIVETMFRQYRVFLWASLGTFALAMLFIFGTHKKYSSEMVLLVQNARGAQVVSAEPTGITPPVADVTEEQVNSQIEVLQSQDVVDEVIAPGWNSVSPDKRSRAELDAHGAAVSYLMKHLEVTPTKKSHVISVLLKEQDPKVATDTLNRLLTVFMAKQRTLSRPAGTSQFFAEEAEKYRKIWADAQQKLSDYQQKRSITTPGDKETWLQQQLSDAEIQLRNTDAQVAETEKRIEGDRAELARVSPRQNTQQRTTPDTGYMDQMNSLLVQLQNQRTELLTKYKADDRLVKQIDDQIASTQKALSSASSNQFKDVSTDVNPTWQAADLSYNSNMASLKGIQARRAGLAASISKLQQQLADTEGVTTEFKSLQHEVGDAESNFQLYSQKRDAAQIADAMDAHEFLNVAVVQYPTYGPTPVHPKPLIDTLLAIFSSLFIGAFAVFLAENSRQTFSSSHELEAVSRFPVFAAVPLSSSVAGSSHDSLPPPARVAVLTTPGKRSSTQLSRLTWANFIAALRSRFQGRTVRAAL